MKIRNFLAVLILCVGSLQILGYSVNSQTLRGIGLASGVSPFTKVFSEADGYEAFAASFVISGTKEDGSYWERSLDSEWYSQLKGPYNRRNVYGATLAFAPRLPEKLRDALLSHALAPGSALRKELSIPASIEQLNLTITPRADELGGPYIYSFKKP